MFLKIVLIGISLLLTIISFHLTKHKKYRVISEKFGSSQGLPFFGVFFTLFEMKELLHKWPKLIRNSDSKSAFVWFGPFVPVFYTSNHNYVQKVLFSPDCNKKSNNYALIHKEIGAGIMSLEGSTWKRHRKLLDPLFNNRVLMHSFPVFNRESSIFVKELEHVVGKGDVKLTLLIQKLVIRTSFAFFLDFELEGNNIKHVLLMDHFINFLKIFGDRMGILTLTLDPVFRWTKFYQPYVESKEFFFDFLQKILHDKIKTTHNINEDIIRNDKIYIQRAIAIYLNGDFSFNELLSELKIILFASFDTSSVTLENLILMLAMHPQYQEKLFEEVLHFFPDKDFDVNYEGIQHLVFMDQFINETLRVIPTAPVIGRNTTKNIKISEELVIPMGTNIIIDLFKLHRDKDIWGPKANFFNPDNFLPDNLIGKHLCAFLPFVKGRRNCIGWRYILYFLKSSLAKIVRNYRFKTRSQYEDLHILFNLTVEHKVSHTVEVYRR